LWREAQARLQRHLGNDELVRLNGALDRSLERLSAI
jgi:hypothetical protein